MNFLEISKVIDKSKDNEDWVDTSVFDGEFDCNFGYLEVEHLKAYWIGNWYSTDTIVGWKMYFLYDEPVAYSFQCGRKNPEEIKWFSKKAARKVKQYLFSLMEEDDDMIETISIEVELGDCYKVGFNTQLLSHHYTRAFYNDEPIEILNRIKEEPDWGIDKKLKIKLKDSTVKIVEISELNFKIHVAE